MSDVIKTDEFLEYVQANSDRIWIFLDTETLGFNPDKHQMTEVAAKAVRFTDKGIEEVGLYHEKAKLLSLTRLRMMRPYKGKGLSYQDLLKMTNYGEPLKNRTYIDEKDMLSGVLDFIDGYDDPILVAHNSSFDMRYLNGRHNCYCTNKNPYDDYEVLDTLKVMKTYFTAYVATESKRFKHRWLAEDEKNHIVEMRRIRKTLQKKKKRMSLKLGNVAAALNINSDGWHSAKFDVEILISTMQQMLVLFNNGKGKEFYPEKTFL